MQASLVLLAAVPCRQKREPRRLHRGSSSTEKPLHVSVRHQANEGGLLRSSAIVDEKSDPGREASVVRSDRWQPEIKEQRASEHS